MHRYRGSQPRFRCYAIDRFGSCVTTACTIGEKRRGSLPMRGEAKNEARRLRKMTNRSINAWSGTDRTRRQISGACRESAARLQGGRAFMVIMPSSLVARSGGPMRRSGSFLYQYQQRSADRVAFIPCWAIRARAGSRATPKGRSARSCSPASGTSGSAFSATLVQRTSG